MLYNTAHTAGYLVKFLLEAKKAFINMVILVVSFILNLQRNKYIKPDPRQNCLVAQSIILS